MKAAWLWAVSLVGISGCVQMYDAAAARAARLRAANDLNCPYDDLSAWRDPKTPPSIGPSYSSSVPVLVHVRGCARATKYSCFSTESGEICLHEPPAQIAEDPGPPPAAAVLIPSPEEESRKHGEHGSFVQPNR